ncbi:MAG: DUF2628 domain-containing protein [Beijerinckiaceae bacterium]
MASYTIHLPPPDRGTAADTARFRLVRDGLAPWAMVLWPVWFLAKRLWLPALAVYLVWAALNLGLYWLGVSPPVIALCWIAFVLLIGLEAHSVERWGLARRGWVEAGVAVAGNAAEAEARAVTALAEPPWPAPHGPDAPRAMSSGAIVQSAAIASQTPVVLGLFPEPRR